MNDPASDLDHRWSVIRNRQGFTLIELLVVITIIALLIGILVPVIGKVRIGSQKADSQNFVNQLVGAIERYQTDFRAYPGPLANNEIDLSDQSKTYAAVSAFTGGLIFPTALPAGYDFTSQTVAQLPLKFTMSENLVLGLLGGVSVGTMSAGKPTLLYDPSQIGAGPVSLNTIGISKRYPAYIDARQLSWQQTSAGKAGHYFDAAGAADDSIVPEFVDRFTDPMPILYLRAKVGSNAVSTSDLINPILTDDLGNANGRPGQYDSSQYIAYTAPFSGAWPSLTRDTAMPPAATSASIGVGRSAKGSDYTPTLASSVLYHGLFTSTWTAPAYPTMTKGTANYAYPYNAYPYFTGSTGNARQKDAYILISAGADRVYGTPDDITNFGTVGE